VITGGQPPASDDRRRSTLHRAEGLHQHRDLHYIKPDYIDPNINVKLYDYIKLR
jgi:hypothetical protein